MTKKKCLITVAMFMALALICVWVYYFFINEHEFFCDSKVELVCPEWLEKCYEEIEAWYETACPKKDKFFGCEYKNVEICKHIEDRKISSNRTESPLEYYSGDCRMESGWVCPEWLNECYIDMSDPKIFVDCPTEEDGGCEYKQLEVCN